MNTPSESPTDAMTISSAPRALSPAPSAAAARLLCPASRAPNQAPANFATIATPTTTPAQGK